MLEQRVAVAAAAAVLWGDRFFGYDGEMVTVEELALQYYALRSKGSWCFFLLLQFVNLFLYLRKARLVGFGCCKLAWSCVITV